MQLVKLLIGAVVGGALGIALMVALEAFAQLEFSWIVIVIGILVGLAIRWIANTGRSSYLNGAVAALVTLATFIGGKYAVATVLQSLQTQQASRPAAAAEVEIEERDALAGGGAAEPVTELIDMRGTGGAPGAQFDKITMAPLDALWLVVGALIAYELGKGRGPAKPHSGQADQTKVDELHAQMEEEV